jgi:hypothetical protein
MRRVLSALSAAMLMAVLASGATIASHAAGDNVAPNSNSHTLIAGNPQCGAVSAGGFNLKIEAENIVVGGVYGNIRITAYDGTYISWALVDVNDHDADTVIVKGGPNAISYSYDTFDDWDTRLTAPKNPNNGKYYGISHISFCFDDKAGA